MRHRPKYDYWLSRPSDDRYVLTPCSAYGHMSYPDLRIGRRMGGFSFLDKEQSEFVAQVLEDSHYKVKRLDHRSAHPGKPWHGRVWDTRPQPITHFEIDNDHPLNNAGAGSPQTKSTTEKN